MASDSSQPPDALLENLQAEIRQLTCALEEASAEKIQAAQYGLQVTLHNYEYIKIEFRNNVYCE